MIAEAIAAAPAAAQAADERALEEMCAEFGAVLGLDGPAPRAALEAALRDESYAQNLLASRRHPALLRMALESPPPPRGPAALPSHSPLQLARRATAALSRWAGTGFATVDQAVFARRRAACLACPSRRPDTSPESLGSCGLCGCRLGPKIRMASESCPDRHPFHAGETRWGEPGERAG